MSKHFDRSVQSLKNWLETRTVVAEAERKPGVGVVHASQLVKVGGLYRIRDDYKAVWRLENGADGRRYIVRADDHNTENPERRVVDDSEENPKDKTRRAYRILHAGKIHIAWICRCGQSNIDKESSTLNCFRCGEVLPREEYGGYEILAKGDKPKNPWAICHTVVDKKKNPEKFERCVKKVKEKM